MASVPQKEQDDMASTISKLAIGSGKTPGKNNSLKSKQPVADSWEDEDVSDEEEEEEEEEEEGKDTQEAEAGMSSTPSSLSTPAVPPPTPASPLGYDSPHEWASLGSQSRSRSQSQSQSPVATSASGSGSGTPARRPEKTDAVARRMIAAGLGLKAPKQTEEQRAYQKSVREQEKRRREEERAEEERQKELAEKARASVWDD
ncbi:hypothetical protein V8C37DRAFT_341037 [Trichoderma ceciliae]